jgi:nucleotide-binding universal stress UspA family protein
MVKTKAERKEKKMPGIIVGIDGSGHSRRALDWAIGEAAVRHAPLTVLTVQQVVNSFWAGPAIYPGDAELAEHARKIAQDETDDAVGKLPEDARPPQVTVLGVPGLPAEAILAAARDADMIVVGSRGAGGFKKLLMGSVASQVTRHARIPVVVIPADNT